MKRLRKWFLKKFLIYKETEVIVVSWSKADELLRSTSSLLDDNPNKWHLSKEEDSNRVVEVAWLCKRERILE